MKFPTLKCRKCDKIFAVDYHGSVCPKCKTEQYPELHTVPTTGADTFFAVLGVTIILVVGGGTIAFWHHVCHVWPEQRAAESERAKAKYEQSRVVAEPSLPKGGGGPLQERIDAANMRIRLREAGVAEDQVKIMDALHREAFK